jgi:hypothetical protein
MSDLRKLLGTGLLALLVSSCGYLNPSKDQTVKDQDLVPWSESRRLTWADFQGQPEVGTRTTSYLYPEQSFALLRHRLAPVGKPELKLAMNKKKSWADKTKVTDRDLLYLQTEFDIYELHVRKLRKRLSETNLGVVDPNGVWESVVRAEREEEHKALKQFHEETQHGESSPIVTQWSAKVLREIKDLDGFKEDTLNFK